MPLGHSIWEKAVPSLSHSPLPLPHLLVLKFCSNVINITKYIKGTYKIEIYLNTKVTSDKISGKEGGWLGASKAGELHL